MSHHPGSSTAAAMPLRTGLPAARPVLWIAALGVAALGAITGLATVRGGSSGAGSFSTGDCVSLTSSSVRLAGCAWRHDGQVVAVLRQTYQSCPAGSEEFDVTDGTGNLCIDPSKQEPPSP